MPRMGFPQERRTPRRLLLFLPWMSNSDGRSADNPDEVLTVTTSSSDMFGFGPYRLEPGLGLTRGGSYIALAPKELGVLEALVKREGGIVSKEELATEVWSDQAPSDDSLARTVYSLRKILAGGSETFIETAHRRGYRLAVPVRRIRKSSGRRSIVAKSVETSPAAYAAFLEGRQFANRGSSPEIERAIEHFELALQIDPGYVVALGAIAECMVYQAIRRYMAPRDVEKRARTVCHRALAIDRELVSAHAALGWIEGAIGWNDDAALAALNEALALDPDYARGYLYRGWVFRGMGHHCESLENLYRACALDPYPVGHERALAYSLFCANRIDEALSVARQMIKREPDNATAYTHLATYAGYLGMHEEAIAAGRESRRLLPHDATLLVGLAYALARAGRRAEALALAREITEANRPAAVRSLIAPVFAALGDREQAVRWLERAAEERCPWFRSVLADPRLAELEEVKKFQRLVGNTVLGSL